MKLVLAILLIILTSCETTKIKHDKQNINVVNKNLDNNFNKSTPQALMPKNHLTLVLDDSKEKKQLAKIAQYIKNSAYLINKAQALQNPNTRYKFNYDILRRDLHEVISAIDRHIKQNNTRQTPRNITPLTLRY